jgi:hypothetical protein
MAVNSVIQGIYIKPEVIPLSPKTNLPLPQFKAGEVLWVNVIEKIAADQYLMSAKGSALRAASSVLLNPGDKIRVRVQSVLPQIVFNLLDALPQEVSAKINAQLIQWRANPDSFAQLLGRLSEFSALLKATDLPGFLPKEADALLSIFTSIIFSPRTRNNQLFVKDFLSRFGLFLESDLAREAAFTDGKGAGVFMKDNLKAYLLKLAASLHEEAQGEEGRAGAARLAALASFTSEALSIIETRQALNTVFQSNESGLYLQVPLALGQAYGQADIFIKPDDHGADGKNKFSSCRFVIFLDMDILGRIAVDALLREGRIKCVIRCENTNTVRLIGTKLDKLKEALIGTGYNVDLLDCLKAQDIATEKKEYIDEILTGSTGIVNDFV